MARIKYEHQSKLIRTKREKANITQMELAALVGTHSQFISNVERGLAEVPLSRVAHFCKALKISVKELKKAKVADFEMKLDSNIDRAIQAQSA